MQSKSLGSRKTSQKTAETSPKNVKPHSDGVHAKGGRTLRKDAFLPSKHLYETLPSKNPSKNLVFAQNPYRCPSKNPSKKHLPLKNLLRTRLRSMLLHLACTLDGRNLIHAIVIAESLARVIAVIRIASVRWQSYLRPKHRNYSSETLRSLCCDSNRAIGVHSFNIRSTWNCGMACESWPRSLNASDWRLAILPI